MKNLDIQYYSSLKIAGVYFQVYSTHKGIRRIFLNYKETKVNSPSITKLHPDDPYMFNIFNELKEYFNGERKKFNVPLDIEGTEFQKKVWNELMKIPYGKLKTYKEVAIRIGNKNAVRAIGRANSTNHIPIIIPCHRVIASNGSLGGYSGGISLKEKLLELEGSLSLELFE
ncbi:MAG: methylated-DNA--[protein]-cysteine S-methyltransferase [Ignavibacteriaceae bacterium]|nr:methylated-DNA--[protein]-cysteine S-methyltransferase [Ignavibacteriaceae bacterium]